MHPTAAEIQRQVASMSPSDFEAWLFELGADFSPAEVVEALSFEGSSQFVGPLRQVHHETGCLAVTGGAISSTSLRPLESLVGCIDAPSYLATGGCSAFDGAHRLVFHSDLYRTA